MMLKFLTIWLTLSTTANADLSDSICDQDDTYELVSQISGDPIFAKPQMSLPKEVSKKICDVVLHTADGNGVKAGMSVSPYRILFASTSKLADGVDIPWCNLRNLNKVSDCYYRFEYHDHDVIGPFVSIMFKDDTDAHAILEHLKSRNIDVNGILVREGDGAEPRPECSVDEQFSGIAEAFTNDKYEVVPTYPYCLLMPKDYEDDILSAVTFRSLNRFPMLRLRYADSGGLLLRSSQPIVNWNSKGNDPEMKMMKRYKELSKSTRMVVFDARSFAAALANTAKMGGYESDQEYDQVDFLGIPNIHDVRSYFYTFRKSVLEFGSDFTEQKAEALSSFKWMMAIGQLLEGAEKIKFEVRSGSMVLVHCTDGWDRTAQLSALAQILISPKARTIAGFIDLMKTEWDEFGHKFGDRVFGLTSSNEVSPIFLQFIECVWQLLKQKPSEFEFSDQFLTVIVDKVRSGWYANTVTNSQKELELLDAEILKVRHSPALSLWDELTRIGGEYRSTSFIPQMDVWPRQELVVSHLPFWAEFHLRHFPAALSFLQNMRELEQAILPFDDISELEEHQFYAEEKPALSKQL